MLMPIISKHVFPFRWFYFLRGYFPKRPSSDDKTTVFFRNNCHKDKNFPGFPNGFEGEGGGIPVHQVDGAAHLSGRGDDLQPRFPLIGIFPESDRCGTGSPECGIIGHHLGHRIIEKLEQPERQKQKQKHAEHGFHNGGSPLSVPDSRARIPH